jgi:hypothetical protein
MPQDTAMTAKGLCQKAAGAVNEGRLQLEDASGALGRAAGLVDDGDGDSGEDEHKQHKTMPGLPESSLVVFAVTEWHPSAKKKIPTERATTTPLVSTDA